MNNLTIIDILRGQYQRRREKESLIREMAEQLIDAGYRVMAKKAHPDNGGSTEKMENLSDAREFLKDAIFPLGRTHDEVRRIKAREKARERRKRRKEQ
jgi:hypothetical protein